MTETQRLNLIMLGERAVAEIEASRLGENETSVVFEDAFRELVPERAFLADNLHGARGFFQETVFLKFMVDYLRDLPVERATTRASEAIYPVVMRAYKRGLLDREMEDVVPFLRDPDRFIRKAVAESIAWTNPKSRESVTFAVIASGFNLHSRQDARRRWGGQRGARLWALIQRVATIAAEAVT